MLEPGPLRWNARQGGGEYWEREHLLSASEESDHLVVLGGRESRPQGEGGDRETEPVQETWSTHEGVAHDANLTAGNSEQGDK